MIDWLKRADIDPEIELNGDCIPIALRRHRTAKRLTMRLAPDGSAVNITLPNWANASEAIAFAHARAEWLSEQHAKIPQQKAPEPGGYISFRGEKFTLIWDETARRMPVLDDGQMVLGGPKESMVARIQRWLERQALALFEDDMREYCANAKLDEVPVGLSRAQKRWGSCSDKSRIRLNWRLVQAPDFVRRSVVAHEVTHLVHFDHSPAFHALLDDIYDGDIKYADRWLKRHGRSLYTSFG